MAEVRNSAGAKRTFFINRVFAGAVEQLKNCAPVLSLLILYTRRGDDVV